MNNETSRKLAASLTAETAELLPYLPYLLQDLWMLGSSPADMIRLLEKHMLMSKNAKVLDLGCGKGAVAIPIAARLRVSVKGIDLMPDFVSYAIEKAKAFDVSTLCTFVVGDINEAVERESGYDCAILGALGDVLGTPEETLVKLRRTIKPGGCVLLDDAYLRESVKNSDIRYKNYEYLTYAQWMEAFKKTGFTLLEAMPNIENVNTDEGIVPIQQRARELIAQHPEKKALFEGYIQSQINECNDLENSVMGITWILRAI